MRGEEVGRARIDVAPVRARFEFGIASHRGEEPHRAIRIVAGARGDADADAVGFEFLRAREAGERDLGFGERQRAVSGSLQQVVDDADDQRDLAGFVFADRGVAARSHAPFRATAPRRARSESLASAISPRVT